MYDLIIKNGMVVDGSGADAFLADVAVKDGKISDIGELSSYHAETIIDAAGKLITPGFIDMHSHADITAPIYPNMESCLGQGITTVFTGHCGLSLAPVDKYWQSMFGDLQAMNKITPPTFGGVDPSLSRFVEIDLMRPVFKETYGVDLDWNTWGEYLAHLDKCGIGTNIISVVGQAQIRTQVMGADFKRTATEAEIQKMQEYVTSAMEQGSWGLSFGLDYEPGVFADTHELIELAKCVKPYNGILTAHVQFSTFRMGKVNEKHTLMDGIRELLDIGKQAGVNVHISHISNGYEYKLPDVKLEYYAAQLTLDLINEYRAQGVHVTWDILPNYRWAIFYQPYLASKVSLFVRQCGGLYEFSRKLGIGNYKREVLENIREGKIKSLSPFTILDPTANPNWDVNLKITRCSIEGTVGKTLRQVADENRKDGVEMALDILQIDPETCVLVEKEEKTPTLEAFLAEEDATIGMDIFTCNYDSVYLDEDMFPRYVGGPTDFSGMIKILTGGFTDRFEDIIAKMTGNSAKVLRLTDRGFIRKGFAADILVIDKDNLNANTNFVDPRQAPSGLDYVIVNGIISVDCNKHLHPRAGAVLRHATY